MGHVAPFMFAGLFCCVGILIWYAEPVLILSCRYVETSQVDCQLKERMVGLIPLGEMPITHLMRAYVKRETRTSENDDGKRNTYYVYKVILVQTSGEFQFGDFSQTKFTSERASRRINDFLNAPTDESLTVFRWEGMLMGGIFFLVGGFLSVGAFLLVVGPDAAAKSYQRIKRKLRRS